MNKGITVAELYKACAELMNKGLGDKCIQISSDDEGNSFHSLFYSFTTIAENVKSFVDAGLVPDGLSVDEIVLLG